MGYGNLRQWIEQLRKGKDLAIIEEPVDPCLELAEIHRRVIQEEGPALLFTNVKGTPFPVATNLFGTARRVDQVFGPQPEELMKSMMSAAEILMQPTISGIWKEKGTLFNMLKVGIRNIPQGEAPVLGICRSTDPLKGLPRITSWQEEDGPYITLPLVYTESVVNPKDHNLGMYRVQIQDDNTAAIRWHHQKGGGFHHHEAEQRGEVLPVSVFVGGPPALMASAMAPLPERVSELLLASAVLGGKLPMVKDPLGGHRIPSEAEFAIRGIIPQNERRSVEGLRDHCGYNSLEHDFPVLHVQRLWHRKDAIYPATIVGKPRQEDYYLDDFLQRLMSPVYSLVMPSVHSLRVYKESGPHNLVSAVVRESYSREAMVSAFRIMGEGQLALTKFLMLTDEPVDLTDFPKLMETVLERFNPAVDLFVLNKTAHDSIDYTRQQMNHGSKAVMIGVGRPVRDLPRSYEEGLIPGIQEALPYCGGCLTVSGASYTEDPGLPSRLVASLQEKETAWPLVIITDNAAETVQLQTSFLWNVFTRFNPATDIYAESEVNNHHLGYKLPIVIDARMKPEYPDELTPGEGIVELVNRSWKNYFPAV